MKELNIKKAYEYYCKGLNSKEIALILGCSYRTIQNYMSEQNWKQKRLNSKKQRKEILYAKNELATSTERVRIQRDPFDLQIYKFL